MTVCTSCGTSQGPFVRDADFPNKPVCGYPPRYRFATPKDKFKAVHDRVRECLSRRDKRYEQEATPQVD